MQVPTLEGVCITMRLKDKVAIITGGTSGIGRGSSYVFAREGAKVVIVGINEAQGKQVQDDIVQQGGEAFFIQTDVSQVDQVESMVEQVKETYGRIDVLFNNAFWNKVAPALELTLEEWQKTIDVTLTGTFLCCKYVISKMIADGGGSIINTASVGSVVGFEEHPAYNAAKGGVVMLTKNLAIDYGKHQIRVNAISPGIIETPISEVGIKDPERYKYFMSKCMSGRVGQPEDIAYMAVYLASDESTFVTGGNYMVDNGWTII
jgi:NAD(P)-dependent dehydrogenase (short-subunit alcohol dehydrogenase family)